MSDDWEKQLNAELKRGIEIGKRLGAREELRAKVIMLNNLWKIADAENSWNTSSAIHSILIVEEKRLRELEGKK